MEFVKKLLSQDEINIIENIIFNIINISKIYFNQNIIDYEHFYNKENAINLIIKFLNNFTDKINAEIEYNYQFPKYKLIITLIRPITENKLLDIILKKKINKFDLDLYILFNNKTYKFDISILNLLMAYLVSFGLIYDFELKTIIKNKYIK